jgi:hypothetical protein
VGDVSSKTVELLAEAEFFDQFWRDVQSLDLPAVIRVAGDDIARCESVTLDALTDDQKERLKEVIHTGLAEVEDAVHNLDWSMWERFRLQFFAVPLEQMRDRLAKLPGFRK